MKSPPAAVADLAPTGKLRAAINLGNPVLASKDAKGEARGAPLAIVPYAAAGRLTDDAKNGVWEIAFVALDPKRGAEASGFVARALER